MYNYYYWCSLLVVVIGVLVVNLCCCYSTARLSPPPTPPPTQDNDQYLISTVIGNGNLLLNADLPALSASIGLPTVVRQSSKGDIYIGAVALSDTEIGSGAIFKVTFNRKEGTSLVTMLVGPNKDCGVMEPMCDGCEKPQCAQYIMGLALVENEEGDVTSVLFSDQHYHCVRQVDVSTGLVTTFAGKLGESSHGEDDNLPVKSPHFYHPTGLLYDKKTGDLLVADGNNGRIRRVFASEDTVRTVVGGRCYSYAALEDSFEEFDNYGDGGMAIDACLNTPYALGMNHKGDLVFSDRGSNRLRIVFTNGTIDTIVGGGELEEDGIPAKSRSLNQPSGFTFSSSGELLFTDTGNNQVRKVDLNGIVTTIAGTGSMVGSLGDGDLALNALIGYPFDIITSRIGSTEVFFLADALNSRIRLIHNGVSCFGLLHDELGVCSGQGTCTARNVCECKPGFSGLNCEFTSCFGYNVTDVENVCTGRGECKSLDTCVCDPLKWSGDRCQYVNCFGFSSTDLRTCSSNGQCIDVNNCSCASGFTGERCEHTICFERNTTDRMVCNGHGYCVDPDYCVCRSGYTGGDCKYPVCYSRNYDRITGMETIFQSPFTSDELVLSTETDCSGHGECIAPRMCLCSPGYVDQYCSTPMCFGLNASDPASCNYGRNGTCVSPNNCTCLTSVDSDGYCVPLSCFGKNLTTSPPSCNSHLGQGNCINRDICQCTKGYGGTECEQTVCFGILESNTTNVCNGRGHCSGPDWCECQVGYSGRQCESFKCHGVSNDHPSACSGKGMCTHPDACACMDGFSGESCQYPICFDVLSNETFSVCSGHGVCKAPNKCECHYGYYGSECQTPTCFGMNSTDDRVCSANGVCIDLDKCDCTGGWTSRDCSTTTCFDIASNSKHVCSGRGFCVGFNDCECQPGRTGTNCELNTCFGLNETDPLVCNEHGLCQSVDNCDCFPGWTGKNCSDSASAPCDNINICYSRTETDPLVCNGYGDCVAHDTCNCKNGSSGDQCEVCPVGHHGDYCRVVECFGALSNETNVCSGHGHCIQRDMCNCNQGYVGEECRIPVCNQITADDPGVCNSRGRCIAFDKCQCDSSFVGKDCELVNEECHAQSSELMLVSQPEGELQRISLVDVNCGTETFLYSTMSSTKTLYSPFDNVLYLVREDGVYMFDFHSDSRLRSMPEQVANNLHHSSVFVSNDSMFIVSFWEDEMQFYNLSLRLNDHYDTNSTSEFIPIDGYHPDKFVTMDTSTETVYILARRKSNMTVVILSVCSGEFIEVTSFERFPSLSDIQALMFVDNDLYIMTSSYLSKVENNQLVLINIIGALTVNEKYETTTHVYLKDAREQHMMVFPKNEPMTEIALTVYPQNLIDTSFIIVDAWKPQIQSLSPAAVPEDALTTTWISLQGAQLLLGNMSTITLIDQSSNLSVTAPLVECGFDTLGDACFIPSFHWPSNQRRIEFTDMIIHPSDNQTSVHQSGLSLIYFQPYILSISPTTAIGGDLITVRLPWLSTTHNITCAFVWKKPTGVEVIIREPSVNTSSGNNVHCRVPILEAANNDIVEVYVTTMNRNFTSDSQVPAFFYYMHIERLTFYDSFDHDTIADAFQFDESAVPSSNNRSIEWISYDGGLSRSIIRMRSTLSQLNQRSMLISKSPIVDKLDQQLHVEFCTDSVGSVELWYISDMDQSYHVYGAINVDSKGEASLTITYQLGASIDQQQQTVTVHCPQYLPGKVHTMEVKFVRPEVELLYQNTTVSNESFPQYTVSESEPRRIDIVLKRGPYSPVCSLSLETKQHELQRFQRMFSTGYVGIGQSFGPKSTSSRYNSSLVELQIDRIWISCQYENGCHNSTPPVVNPPDASKESSAQSNVRQYAKKGTIVALSSVAAFLFFLLLIAILIPIIVAVRWGILVDRKEKEKREKNARLEAWKFQFVVDNQVSSVDDLMSTSSVARKMYKVNEEDNHHSKLKSMLGIRKYAHVEMVDMSSVSTNTSDTMSCDTQSKYSF